MNRPIFVYDGDCGFCMRWVDRLRPHFPAVAWTPSSAVNLGEHGLSQSDVERSAWLITNHGRLEGYDAFAGLLETRGRPSLAIARIATTAPLRAVGSLIYRSIANNRSTLGRRRRRRDRQA